MSEKNGKVCCNCKHNIRKPEKDHIVCYCEIKGNKYMGYIEVMTSWCKYWTADRFEQIRRTKNDKRRSNRSYKGYL